MTRRRITVTFTLPTLTKQAFRDPCRVETLLRKYANLGLQAQHLADQVSAMPFQTMGPQTWDYQANLNKIIALQTYFTNLPAKVRERFNYDPARFLAYISNPANLKEAAAKGYIPPSPETQGKTPEPPQATQSASGKP